MIELRVGCLRYWPVYFLFFHFSFAIEETLLQQMKIEKWKKENGKWKEIPVEAMSLQ